MNTEAFNGIDISKHLIYLVDDVTINNTVTSKMLSVTGIRVKAFCNSKEGFNALAEEKPTLVLLDLMMPSMDGLSFLESMRSNPDYDDVKVIIVTAINEISEMMQARKLGANDYITKPVTIDKLLTAVAAQLKTIG